MKTRQKSKRSKVHAAIPPSAELQAELVAALHKYIGGYNRLIVPDLSASYKELKVADITLSNADATFVYVHFAVKIREILGGMVLYTLDGSASGKFHLGQVTSTKICIAPPLGVFTALTVTSIDIPLLTYDEYQAAEHVIDVFPPNLCVPLYPSITINNVSVAECFQPPAKPAPLPNSARFTVALSNLSARTITVHYATIDGSARAGIDYTAVSGTLSIPSLSPSGIINVQLRCRQGEQGDRTFTVNLSNPINCTLVNNQGQGLIIDFVPDQ